MRMEKTDFTYFQPGDAFLLTSTTELIKESPKQNMSQNTTQSKTHASGFIKSR